jgi:hypothetical protein
MYYFINRFPDASIRVEIEGIPPCFYCGEPVTDPSCDGPLVCPMCDMGLNPDGTKWSLRDHYKRVKHFKECIEKYRCS